LIVHVDRGGSPGSRDGDGDQSLHHRCVVGDLPPFDEPVPANRSIDMISVAKLVASCTGGGQGVRVPRYLNGFDLTGVGRRGGGTTAAEVTVVCRVAVSTVSS
jgi:hypothetical protein